MTFQTVKNAYCILATQSLKKVFQLKGENELKSEISLTTFKHNLKKALIAEK